MKKSKSFLECLLKFRPPSMVPTQRLPGHTAISMSQVSRDIEKAIEIMSYTLQQRRKGIDYQWTEPYTFFAEREVKKEGPISIEYR